jgi:hypothetical protein
MTAMKATNRRRNGNGKQSPGEEIMLKQQKTMVHKTTTENKVVMEHCTTMTWKVVVLLMIQTKTQMMSMIQPMMKQKRKNVNQIIKKGQPNNQMTPDQILVV